MKNKERRRLRFLELSEAVADALVHYYENEVHEWQYIAKRMGVDRRKLFDMMKGDYNFSFKEIAKVQHLVGKSFKWEITK